MCSALGIEVIPYTPGAVIAPTERHLKRFSHNCWRCRNAAAFAEHLRSKGSSKPVDELLRQIDNAGVYAKALGL